jgi:hypothetical protein
MTPMSTHKPAADEPLPATQKFVFGVGIFIVIGWILMFFLLRARW